MRIHQKGCKRYSRGKLKGIPTKASLMERNSFGARLKRVRVKAKLTQQEMAEVLNCSIWTIRHWETGYRTPAHGELIITCLERLAKISKN